MREHDVNMNMSPRFRQECNLIQCLRSSHSKRVKLSLLEIQSANPLDSLPAKKA